MRDQQPSFGSLFILLFLFLASVNNVFANDAEKNNKHQLQQLLAPFLTTSYIKLAYREKRFSLFLKQPQEHRGFIEYTRPAQLIKQELSPGKKKIVIQQNQLTIYTYDAKTGNDSKQTVFLEDYPQFKQFSALFTGLLQGDAAQLTQYYRYEIYSMPDDQTGLLLKPHIADPFSRDQQNINKHIEIIFHHQLIKKITITGYGGERSELYFDDQNMNQPVSKNHSNTAPDTITNADTR